MLRAVGCTSTENCMFLTSSFLKLPKLLDVNVDSRLREEHTELFGFPQPLQYGVVEIESRAPYPLERNSTSPILVLCSNVDMLLNPPQTPS